MTEPFPKHKNLTAIGDRIEAVATKIGRDGVIVAAPTAESLAAFLRSRSYTIDETKFQKVYIFPQAVEE